MIGALLFAALTPAQTTVGFAQWVIASSQVRRAGDAVAVELELWIDPEGDVEACEVARFAGSEDTAKKLCAEAVGKRFGPARDAQGTATYGVARTIVVAAARDDAKARNELMQALDEAGPAADVSLAEDAATPLESYLVLVDSHGAITVCQGPASSAAEHVGSVCGALAGERRAVRLSRAGTATVYVERLRVRAPARAS